MAPLLVAAIPTILDGVKTLIDRVIPDKAAAEKAKQELESAESKAVLENALAQIQVNTEEAKSSSLFVAGWRPFVGWVCGAGLAYVAILEPVTRFVAMTWFKYSGPFPVIDTNLTMQVLLGMLGLAGIRGYEKSKGVAR